MRVSCGRVVAVDPFRNSHRPSSLSTLAFSQMSDLRVIEPPSPPLRREDTRTRLLRAGVEVLETGGYASASVAAIAERAGVATGTLYRHFASKADLFVELYRAIGEGELAAMQDAAAVTRSVAEELDAV